MQKRVPYWDEYQFFEFIAALYSFKNKFLYLCQISLLPLGLYRAKEKNSVTTVLHQTNFPVQKSDSWLHLCLLSLLNYVGSSPWLSFLWQLNNASIIFWFFTIFWNIWESHYVYIKMSCRFRHEAFLAPLRMSRTFLNLTTSQSLTSYMK